MTPTYEGIEENMRESKGGNVDRSEKGEKRGERKKESFQFRASFPGSFRRGLQTSKCCLKWWSVERSKGEENAPPKSLYINRERKNRGKRNERKRLRNSSPLPTEKEKEEEKLSLSVMD